MLAQFEETLFQRECDKSPLNWRSLARDAAYDPLAARVDPRDEAGRLARPAPVRQFRGGVAVQYWSDVAFELTRSLRVAANPSQKSLTEAVEALCAFDRSPAVAVATGPDAP